jgi:hypothetical protein
MKVRGLVWLGIPTEEYASAVRLFAGTLGLELAFEEASTVELSTENGDKVQLFGQGIAISISAGTTTRRSFRSSKLTSLMKRAPK